MIFIFTLLPSLFLVGQIVESVARGQYCPGVCSVLLDQLVHESIEQFNVALTSYN